MPEIMMAPSDMTMALLARIQPAVTQWDRVEGIPRTHDIARALRAEVRDALWMLSRQWQLGELIGDDAGSATFAKLHLATTRLTTYTPGDRPQQPFDETVPLESRVEQRPVPLVAGAQKLSLDIRLLMGRYWQKLLARDGLDVKYAAGFRSAFGVRAPNPATTADAAVCAHREAWQYQAAFAGRATDGYDWYAWLVAHPQPRDFVGVPAPLVINPADVGALDTLAQSYVAWFTNLIGQPVTADENAWDPARLEYRFACSAPQAQGGRTDLVAEEYYNGTLDWYSVDIGPPRQAPGVRPEVRAAPTMSFIPTSVEFNGMANPRWWSFEDRRVNFGGIQPDTTDIAKLLLMQFAVEYSNDWCVVPLPIELGSWCEVRGLVVTNVFGERLWIDAAGHSPEQAWQRWSMFTLNRAGGVPARPEIGLLLLPTVPKVQEGAALEECVVVRDEMANMVWGVETTVPLPSGQGRSGSGAAAETSGFYQRLLGGPPLPPPLPNEAKAQYQVMNAVPENWIPFVPVHVAGSNREIQLQRASMPRIVEGSAAPIEKVKPRTSLLREGLDRAPARPYFIHEEEVPRSGVHVSQAYQRTRWTDGSIYVWLGARKRVGRGEGSSGLTFDRVVEIPNK